MNDIKVGILLTLLAFINLLFGHMLDIYIFSDKVVVKKIYKLYKNNQILFIFKVFYTFISIQR